MFKRRQGQPDPLEQFRQEVTDSHRMVLREETVPFAPCPNPRTLLSSLTAEQQRYYRVFRDNFLEGRPLRSDLGYITLLAQELINGLATLDVGRTPHATLDLWRLVYLTAKHNSYVQTRGIDWVLALNHLEGSPYNPGGLVASLNQKMDTPQYPQLAIDGIVAALMEERGISTLEFTNLFRLERKHMSLLTYTKDVAFAREVTELAISAYFRRHMQPSLQQGKVAFTGWVNDKLTPVVVPAFNGLLHPKARHPLRVAEHHTYPNDLAYRIQDVVADLHKYALYLARVGREAPVEGAEAAQVRAGAHRALMNLIRERLPDDLERRVVITEELRADNTYTITPDDTRGLGERSAYDSRYETLQQRYERVMQKYESLKDTRVEKAPAAQFPKYTVTRDITDLNERQLQQYLQWRTKWRDGHTPPTNETILRVYAAEVINLVGFDTPQAAYDELVKFFNAYREQVPWTAGMWLLDFARRHEIKDTPNDALLRAVGRIPMWAYEGAVIAAWIKRRDYSLITHDVMGVLADFNPTTAQYYSKSKKQELLDKALITAIKTVAEHFEELYGRDIWDHYMPERTWRELKPSAHEYADGPFGGLTRDQNLKITRNLFAAPNDNLPVVRALLSNALKHTENIFRKSEKAGGRRQLTPTSLWTDKLQAKVEAAVTPLLEPPKPKPVVRLDQERLAQLERDSAGIRERLIDPAVLAEAERETEPSGVEPTTSSAPEATVTTGVADDEYEQLLAALGHASRQLLALIASGSALSTLEGVARQRSAPLDLLIEEINEHALNTLGDNIIDAYEEPPAVIEEHQAGIQQALQTQLTVGDQVE